MPLRSSSFCPKLFGLFLLLVLSSLPAEELTEEKVMELELAVVDAPVAEAFKMLEPYLGSPSKILMDVIGELMSKSDNLKLEDREILFNAFMKIAGEKAFRYACITLASNDVDLQRKGILLMARTKHAQAGSALKIKFGSTPSKTYRLEILVALQELGDRSVLPFIEKTIRLSKVAEIRMEARVTAIRLGAIDGLSEILEHYINLREKIYMAVGVLDWQRHAERRQYKISMRDIGTMKKTVGRIETAFHVACGEHPLDVLKLLKEAKRPEVMDIFHDYIHLLVRAVSAENTATLADLRSTVLAVKAMRELAEWVEGSKAVNRLAVDLMESDSPYLRERGIRMADLLSADLCHNVIREGLEDEAFRCRLAALKASIHLSPLVRRPMLISFLKTETSIRLRDTAEWLLNRPDAKSALP
jgi:hypothetical protein